MTQIPDLDYLQAGGAEVTLDLVLSHYRQRKARVTYLQIGANDGVSGDPIFPLIEKHSLRGILVEPQRDVFARLKANYSRFNLDDFQFVNAAISARDGFVPLYRIRRETDAPECLHQLASFDREVLMAHARFDDLQTEVVAEKVQALTFDSLFRQIDSSYVDLLQVDTEGYDAEIIRLFDVPHRRPAIINFEHIHLDERAYQECIRTLRDERYKIWVGEQDTIAYCG